MNFQLSKCNNGRHKLLCKLYFLLDCSFSVTVTEKFEHGNLKSDITQCNGDYYIDSIDGLTDNEIEQNFYDLYLQLKPVS